MKKVRTVSIIMVLIALCVLFLPGCGDADTGVNQGAEKKPRPEVGKWHTEYKVNDIDDDEMAEEDRLLLSMIAGNVMFEMNVEFCEDGTFTYTINTDEVKEEIADSVSKITSFFIDIDLSMFTDRLVEAVFDDVLETGQSEYVGEYTVADDGLITAKDEGLIKGSEPAVIYFKMISKRLVQVDEEGNQVFAFKQADNN